MPCSTCPVTAALAHQGSLLATHPTGGEPLYRQLARALAGVLRRRNLAAGTKLPSIRQLAATLGVNPKTVAAAYRVLKALGLVVAFERCGTYVAPHLPTVWEAVVTVTESRRPVASCYHLARRLAASAAAPTSRFMQAYQQISRTVAGLYHAGATQTELGQLLELGLRSGYQKGLATRRA